MIPQIPEMFPRFSHSTRDLQLLNSLFSSRLARTDRSRSPEGSSKGDVSGPPEGDREAVSEDPEGGKEGDDPRGRKSGTIHADKKTAKQIRAINRNPLRIACLPL